MTPKRPPDRIGLFGLLLGLCGDQDDADRLSAMCAQPTPTQATGLDGLIGGLILLDSQRGIDRMLAALTGDTSTSGQRLAGLAALAFVMVELTPESSSDILHRASRALGHPDVTAPLIDELRKGRVWDVTDEVLACADSPRDFPAVVRYAMASPAAAAQRFVEHIKREQPMVILEAQQAMEFESANRDLLGPRPAAP